jgi:PAS domain-containing protein
VRQADHPILDSVAHIVITTDATGLIVSFNPAAELTRGYTSARCVGKLTQLAFRDQRERRARSVGVTFMRRDGSRFAALVSTTATRDSGTFVVAIESVRDT